MFSAKTSTFMMFGLRRQSQGNYIKMDPDMVIENLKLDVWTFSNVEFVQLVS
jgi:hypothetical protein